MAKLYHEGKVDIKACKEAHNGWKAHASRGDTYYLIRKMNKLFDELFKEAENE